MSQVAIGEPLGAGTAEPIDRNGAFPRLTDEQRDRLRAAGRIRAVEGLGRENRVIAVHGAHRFLGEINLVTGSPPYLSAVVRDAGEVIQVPAERLRALLAQDEELSNLILRAFMSRRSILIGLGAGLKVVGSRYTEDTRRVRTSISASPRCDAIRADAHRGAQRRCVDRRAALIAG